MITSLTDAQKAKFPEYVKWWTEIGLSCEPLDYDKAVDAVKRAYQVAGLKPPTKFVVCDSPLSGAIAASVLRDTKVGDSVRASVGDSVRASVRDSVRVSVRASVGDSVWASVGDSVWASVRASVGVSVRASVGDSVRASVRDSVRVSVFGAHDAGWLSFYAYFLEECNLEACAKLKPLMDMAQVCGWWIPYKDTVILQHRHCELYRDATGRLHNPSGMAVKYRDGWGVYAWHGLRIPFGKEWIITEPDTITPQKIDAEDNAELRRVMLEIYGHDRYIEQSGMQPIHTDEFGELFRKELPGDEPLVMVRVVNSTPEPDGSYHKYLLRVQPELRPMTDDGLGKSQKMTARNAVASTFGMTGAEYAPAAES